MRNPAQPPDPKATAPASCGGRFELALVAAFKTGCVPPAPGIGRPPKG